MNQEEFLIQHLIELLKPLMSMRLGGWGIVELCNMDGEAVINLN